MGFFLQHKKTAARKPPAEDRARRGPGTFPPALWLRVRSERRGHGPSPVLALGGHHPAKPPLASSLPTSSWLGLTAPGAGSPGPASHRGARRLLRDRRPERSLASFAFSTVSYRHFLPFQQKPVSSKLLFLPSYHIHLYHLSLAFKYHGDSELKTRTGNCFDIVTSSWDGAGISHLGVFFSARWTKPLPPPSISNDFMDTRPQLPACTHAAAARPREQPAGPCPRPQPLLQGARGCQHPPAPGNAPGEQGAAGAALLCSSTRDLRNGTRTPSTGTAVPAPAGELQRGPFSFPRTDAVCQQRGGQALMEQSQRHQDAHAQTSPGDGSGQDTPAAPASPQHRPPRFAQQALDQAGCPARW